jgi:glucosamine--fructose-6-phosphate aminotransferase (isomerizing)
LTVSACGTAFYAGQIAKYWFERYARLPVEIDVASEFRYREVPLEKEGLAVFISQSGETADTLAGLRYCKSQGQRIAAIVNVPSSTIAREADWVLPTLAGPEIGVASTKAFTCQLTALAALAIGAGRVRGTIDLTRERELVEALLTLPGILAEYINRRSASFREMCEGLSSDKDVLYLGRGICFPLAMEGALKLKEITYIHAEGYAAGELKHGPIALIDKTVPVIVIAPKDDLFDKTVSNLQEVAARGGRIVLVSNCAADEVGALVETHISMPDVHPFANPILYALPMQLIAFHTAIAIGADVDQPRNLAKSVTVE